MDSKGISVVTSSMNREKNLLENIKCIQKLSNIQEHIIIDWSSDQDISNTIQSKKIKIFRINDQAFWWHNKAYNTGFHLASSEYILKIDADVLIDHEKFNKLKYWNYDLIVFFKNPNDPGNFLIKKEVFNKINGFNEYFWQWGWGQDHDLVSRATKNVENIKYLKVYETISKIDHHNDERSDVLVNELYKKPDHFYYSYIKATNDTNAFLAKKDLWSSENVLDYSVVDNKIKINHNFDIKDLSYILKFQYKWKICHSFAKVYKNDTTFTKRFFAIFLFLIPRKILSTYFSIKLYIFKN